MIQDNEAVGSLAGFKSANGISCLNFLNAALLRESAAVASKSREYIGFVAGGLSGNEMEERNEIWGLKRNNHKWIEMSQRLNTGRKMHSMVNLDSDELPEC